MTGPTEPTPYDDGDATTDDALRLLLGDAVADVHPTDRLGEIRRRTPRPARPSRRWLPVVAGAGVATAAVVGGVALVGQLSGDDPGPATAPMTVPDAHAMAVYFVGDTDLGPRLFREFQPAPEADDTAAVELALDRVEPSGGPIDRDYRTLWPDSAFTGVDVAEDRITVELGDRAALVRPEGVSNREAWIGVQQVVYTAEAALGESLPVAFEYDGAPVERVLGVAVTPLVERDRQYDVVAPVNISDPTDGQVVEGEVLHARGTKTDAAGIVRWEVRPALDQGDEGLGVGGVTQQLYREGEPDALDALEWAIDVDLVAFEPGDYVFIASVRSTGQTSDTFTWTRDTRTFTVR